VNVPCCVPCNGKLERRYEGPAKTLIREIFAKDGAVELTAEEARVVGLWFLKTWLLLAHPEARHSEPAVAPSAWGSAPEALYSWMTDLEPPSGVSVWMQRVSSSAPRQERVHLWLPTVHADGQVVEFQQKTVRVMGVEATVVYHPNWRVVHPLVEIGAAVQLWPVCGPIDLGITSAH
jgi:hypothetical protein